MGLAILGAFFVFRVESASEPKRDGGTVEMKRVMGMGRELAVLAALLAATISAAMAASLSGVVVGVHDGDTVTVLAEGNVSHKVRLLGIDAPEKAQDYGNRSKQSLSSMVYRKAVEVEYLKVDRYGRLLGKITVGGWDANLAQVEAGMAWHYKMYQKEQSSYDRAAYAGAEQRARGGRVGLWQQERPTAPWDFRKADSPQRRIWQ